MSQRPQVFAPDAGERHEEVFLSRYATALGWATRLAEGDRARAEDLVQDAYVQFTLARPDLGGIQNLDGYLYRMLRNLNISHLRRTQRAGARRLTAVEYDSAELASRVAHAAAATDPRARLVVAEELRACCRYACARKETSKAGSVLILRFFHGYYPREIAAFTRATREAVEERLRVARAEARQFLKDPNSLRFMNDADSATRDAARSHDSAGATDDLLAELRRAVFRSRRGDCPTAESLAVMYGEGAAHFETRRLAHVVSCPRCIEEVNELLGLAPLAERFPLDTLGADARGGAVRDDGKRGGGGGNDDAGGGGGGGGGGDDAGGGGGASGGWPDAEASRRCRRRAREVFEHEPRELCVAVNGQLLAAQKVGAARCEQTLKVPTGERVDFVEVFSEQDVRLLLLSADELNAAHAQSLSASVSLSDARRLEAVLSFEGAWPTVRVVYDDPTLRPAERFAEVEAERAAPAADEGADSRAGSRAGAAWLARALGALRPPKLWLRPASITTALALLVVAALLLTRVYVTPVSAAALLDRSAAAEESALSDARLVLHRTYTVEEVGAASAATLSRRRVEVWRSAARGLRLRRVFDTQGRLLAVERATDDGSLAVFLRDAAPEVSSPGALPSPSSLLEAGEAWRLDPSARTFAALVPTVERVEVEDGLGSYLLNYKAAEPGGAGADDASAGARLLTASLRLSKSDLRATNQTLVFASRGGEAREYRFIESVYERLPAAKVEPKVFEPETELTGARADEGRADSATEAPRVGDASESNASGGQTSPSSSAVASAELEVEVTHLLNQVKANLGEQVSVARTTGGQLRVEALVETEGRKAEILRALGPILNNPAVLLDVATVAERAGRAASAGPTAEREVEVRAGSMPAAEELRGYFAARIAGDARVEQESRELAARAMGRSRQALRHASALKRLVERFSPDEVRALDAEARAKWLAMVREHARAVGREVRALHGELRPVFRPASAQGAGAGSIGGAAVDTRDAADRLLRLSYQVDGAVRSAFTVSADTGGASRVRSAQFWGALADAERLANSIQAAYR